MLYASDFVKTTEQVVVFKKYQTPEKFKKLGANWKDIPKTDKIHLSVYRWIRTCRENKTLQSKLSPQTPVVKKKRGRKPKGSRNLNFDDETTSMYNSCISL